MDTSNRREKGEPAHPYMCEMVKTKTTVENPKSWVEEWESGDRSPALRMRNSDLAGGVYMGQRLVVLPPTTP